MTTQRLLACLDGLMTGSVQRERTGRLRFVYDDGWPRRVDAVPLSLSCR